ncbi:hypothetical protein SAMN04244553_1356 [Nocardia amikacinitolerans]|uniref:Uncharacterized protein n=1 Tax=Nocardia amikacinitolerans TaxID=756689 RepID=A0A285L2G5_9NOCA|nr:hypothetical protein [Nocardia amikacinitolerans]SNY78673.1 hypothetical protein SAMN04244553_1356 [Nocardia amikacinitolerans]
MLAGRNDRDRTNSVSRVRDPPSSLGKSAVTRCPIFGRHDSESPGRTSRRTRQTGDSWWRYGSLPESRWSPRPDAGTEQQPSRAGGSAWCDPDDRRRRGCGHGPQHAHDIPHTGRRLRQRRLGAANQQRPNRNRREVGRQHHRGRVRSMVVARRHGERGMPDGLADRQQPHEFDEPGAPPLRADEHANGRACPDQQGERRPFRRDDTTAERVRGDTDRSRRRSDESTAQSRRSLRRFTHRAILPPVVVPGQTALVGGFTRPAGSVALFSGVGAVRAADEHRQ